MKGVGVLAKMATGIVSRRIVGIANQSITPEVASTLGAALGTHLGANSVVVSCRDFRADSRMVKRAFASGLMSTGVDVLDLHAACMPVLQFALKRFGGSAAVSFCAEHYRSEAVRLRIFESNGPEIGPDNIAGLTSGIPNEENLQRVSTDQIGRILVTENTERIYRSALLNFVHRAQIMERHFKVVIDCALGASSLLFPSVLSDLGVQVVTLNAYAPTHVPETLPNPSSLATLEKTVLATSADLGVALDVEGGRMVLIDETGSIVLPDITAALYIAERCRTHPKGGTAVITETTSNAIHEKINESCIERVWSAHPGAVARKIRDSRAFAGATDKGQLFFPSFIPESDAFLSVLWILEFLAKNETSLSEALTPVTANTPAATKETMTTQRNLGETLQKIYGFCNAPNQRNDIFAIDTLCGVKIVFLEETHPERKQGWVHIHAGSRSNRAMMTIETKEGYSVNDLADQAIDLIHHATK
ncbi:MAG: hypothetical protein ACE5OZ_19515 [Candidatus Heimdallarchaeota archaeon]